MIFNKLIKSFKKFNVTHSFPIAKRLEKIFNTLNKVYQIKHLLDANDYLFSLDTTYGQRMIRISKHRYVEYGYTLSYWEALDGFDINEVFDELPIITSDKVNWIFGVTVSLDGVDVRSNPSTMTAKEIDLAILEVEHALNEEYKELMLVENFKETRNKYFMHR